MSINELRERCQTVWAILPRLLEGPIFPRAEDLPGHSPMEGKPSWCRRP